MTPCIEWAGSTYPNGYGRVWDPRRRKMVSVHRRAMAEAVGWDAIEGLLVLHTCDNPPCYRLDHLFVGTFSDNTQDMLAKGRARPGFCAGNRHAVVKLDKPTADAIRSEYRPGVRQLDLAVKYSVSQRMVSKVVRGESWR